MKKFNFASQRRMHFIRIVLICVLQVIWFFFWAADRLLADLTNFSKECNIVVSVFFGVLLLDWTWLWFEDILFFNKDSILRRLYNKKASLKEGDEKMESIELKEAFWIQSERKNLWLYFKSKIGRK